MRIGFVTLGMTAQNLQEVLDVAASTGSEVMELNGRASVHQDLWAPPVDYAAVAAKISASGVQASSLGGYSDFAQLSDDALDQQVEQFVGYCRLAKAMGIGVVRAFAGDLVEGHTLAELYPRIVAGFRGVADRIAGWGLKVGIENHGRLINDGDALYRLLEDVDSPILGMTIDTGNFCWAGHSVQATERFVEKLAPRAVNVHIKDVRWVGDRFELVAAGRGDLDLRRIFDILSDAGYDGAVQSEYEGSADFYASTLESVAYLRELRDAIR